MQVKIATWDGFEDEEANGFHDVFAVEWTDDAIRAYVIADLSEDSAVSRATIAEDVRKNLDINIVNVVGATT